MGFRTWIFKCTFGWICILTEVVGAFMSDEVPGFIEGSDHSLIQGTLRCSSQVLLQLLHRRHADDDSVTMLILGQHKTFLGHRSSLENSFESFPRTAGTFSLEWWYIQRMAADVKVGFSEPYAASRAFRTTSTAWNWLCFQYLTRKTALGEVSCL